jgi:hypothetical protein
MALVMLLMDRPDAPEEATSAHTQALLGHLRMQHKESFTQMDIGC